VEPPVLRVLTAYLGRFLFERRKMGPEGPGTDRRLPENNECRDEVEELKNYLLETAKRLDAALTKVDEAGEEGHEASTLKTQVAMIQNRIIHACEGKLKRERPNRIFLEVADDPQIKNAETVRTLLVKVKKGPHDER